MTRLANPWKVATCRPGSEAGNRSSNAARAASRARPDPRTSAARSGSAPASIRRANRSRRTAVLPDPGPPVTSAGPASCARTASWASSNTNGGAVIDRMLRLGTDSPGRRLDVGPRRENAGLRDCGAGPVHEATGRPVALHPTVQIVYVDHADRAGGVLDERLVAGDPLERVAQ